MTPHLKERLHAHINSYLANYLYCTRAALTERLLYDTVSIANQYLDSAVVRTTSYTRIRTRSTQRKSVVHVHPMLSTSEAWARGQVRARERERRYIPGTTVGRRSVCALLRCSTSDERTTSLHTVRLCADVHEERSLSLFSLSSYFSPPVAGLTSEYRVSVLCVPELIVSTTV